MGDPCRTLFHPSLWHRQPFIFSRLLISTCVFLKWRRKKTMNRVDRTCWNFSFFPKMEKDWRKLFTFFNLIVFSHFCGTLSNVVFQNNVIVFLTFVWNFKQCFKTIWLFFSHFWVTFKKAMMFASIRRCCILFLCFFVLKSTNLFTCLKIDTKSVLRTKSVHKKLFCFKPNAIRSSMVGRRRSLPDARWTMHAENSDGCSMDDARWIRMVDGRSSMFDV